MKSLWCVVMSLWTFTLLITLCGGHSIPDEKFCEHNGHQSYVSCAGNISDLSSLENEMKKLRGPITIFYLHDATLDTLPPNLFCSRNTPIHTLIIEKVSMKLLDVPVLGGSVFAGLSETLERLEIYASKGVFGWDWGALLGLMKLQALIVEKSDFILVRKSICSAPDLRLIQLNDAIIDYVESTAFDECKNLTFVSLSNNRIRSLTRSMFPRPARRLWSLDISYNELTELEYDLFEDMCSLREVKLNHNMLRHFSYQILAPVWRNLNQLWLQGNDFECDSLCWTHGSVQHPLFFDSMICQGNSTKLILFEYFEYSDVCRDSKNLNNSNY